MFTSEAKQCLVELVRAYGTAGSSGLAGAAVQTLLRVGPSGDIVCTTAREVSAAEGALRVDGDVPSPLENRTPYYTELTLET